MGWVFDKAIIVAATVLSLIISVLIIRKNWGQYGLLFLLSAAVGNILCLLFVNFGFYTYPVRLFPDLSPMPFTAVTTAFPMLVLLGVRFSPRRWPWKIPFYWTIVHLGVFAETYALEKTLLIRYNFKWDLWDSYTWWWIYLLLFEWVGGRIVSPEHRSPIEAKAFQYGRWAWATFHFIVIVTIFLGGYYLGRLSK